MSRAQLPSAGLALHLSFIPWGGKAVYEAVTHIIRQYFYAPAASATPPPDAVPLQTRPIWYVLTGRAGRSHTVLITGLIISSRRNSHDGTHSSGQPKCRKDLLNREIGAMSPVVWVKGTMPRAHHVLPQNLQRCQSTLRTHETPFGALHTLAVRRVFL
jgi:hypothetical protein